MWFVNKTTIFFLKSAFLSLTTSKAWELFRLSFSKRKPFLLMVLIGLSMEPCAPELRILVGTLKSLLKRIYPPKTKQNHTIRKVKFFSKNSISTKPQHFHKMFLTIFLVKSKLSTAKKSKTTTFSRVFHPQKIDDFLGKSKLNFWTKNEDFEQCGIQMVPR